MGISLRLVLCFVALPCAAVAEVIDVELYNPLAPGDTWVYQDQSLNRTTFTVLATTEEIGNQQTQVEQESGGQSPGAEENYTNDENGLRVYRFYYPHLFIQGVGSVDTYIDLSPPMTLAHPTAVLGDLVSSSGTATFTYVGYGSVSLAYQSTGGFTYREEVSVPFGTFNALRLEYTLSVNGTVQSQPVSYVSTSVAWSVPGVGGIKSVTDSPEGSTELDLVSTNLTPVPEPAGTQLGALLALVALASRSGSQRTGK